MHCSLWNRMKDPVTIAAVAISTVAVWALGVHDGAAHAHAATPVPAMACAAVPSHHGLLRTSLPSTTALVACGQAAGETEACTTPPS